MFTTRARHPDHAGAVPGRRCWSLRLPAAAGQAFAVGLVVSIFQTVTSIQDQTLSYVPRIVLVWAGDRHATLGVSLQQAAGSPGG